MMNQKPLLKLLMSPFPYSIDIDAPAAEALEQMQTHSFHHLPVTDGHELVGIITERDIKNFQSGAVLQGNSGHPGVRELYIHDAYIVDINEPLDNVLMEMSARHIGSVLVTRKGKLAGVFTSSDACRSFGEYLRKRFPRDDGNDAA